jgi:putative transposase
VDLMSNMLLEWAPTKENDPGTPLVERVLDFDISTDEVVVINIFDPKAFPVLRSYRLIEDSYHGGALVILDKDPFREVMIAENDISPKHRKYRDDAWDGIAPLLEHEDIEFMIYPWKRGPLIEAHRIKSERLNDDGTSSRTSTATIYKRLRQWWQSGRRKNAFLPDFRKCGAPGKPRLALTPVIDEEHHKVGRRSALAISTGRMSTGIGVRMTKDIHHRFQLGISRFYNTPDERTLRQAFELTIQKYFAVGYDIVDGNPVPVPPAEDARPTFDQFAYWYEHERNLEKEKRSRTGDIEFELKSRQMLGDPRRMGFAPGSVCQIDATILNLYLVSAMDRTRIIGRPVVYHGVDVFSSALMGLCLLLEGPSWVGAMLALDNVCGDKVSFCAEYGIEITEDDWPCKGLPNAILADRGEFEGYSADTLVNSFGIRIHNTGVRRADWKSYVERSFGLAKEKVARFVPGYVPPMGRVRGDPDYALKAVLTPDECRKLLICYALDYNMNHYLQGYRKNEFMVADHVPRYPLELWNWGIRSRGGLLTSPSQDIVRLNLLPRKQASITERGIHFEGDIYYECDSAHREGWFVKARDRGHRKIEVAYDPRTTERIYLPLDGGTKLEVCTRTLASTNLPALDCYDAMDYYALERAAYQASETRRLTTGAALQSRKDAIVGEATEKTHAALAAAGDLSKRARRSGIRENRAAEKQIERDNNQWLLGGTTSSKPTAMADKESRDTSNAEYVPASSKLSRIGELIDQEWKKNDTKS